MIYDIVPAVCFEQSKYYRLWRNDYITLFRCFILRTRGIRELKVSVLDAG